MREISKKPSNRLFACLFLLTFLAGWVDAFSFLNLGKVFTSFMSGNILFMGAALGQNDIILMTNATGALMAFFFGAGIGGAVLRRYPPVEHGLSSSLLALQCITLLVFAIGWQAFTPLALGSREMTGLLILAAFAMGIQAVSVAFLSMPGIATNALTGTVTLLARSLSKWLSHENPDEQIREGFLILLCLAYTASAALVSLTMDYNNGVFVPVFIILLVILINPIRR